jgi:hypothetical protein
MFNTYAIMKKLVEEGLAQEKVFGNLTLFKYSRQAMQSGKLHTDERLMECRGHVYDNTTGAIIQTPFRKSFNYLENDWWRAAKPTDKVTVYKKYNGFMLSVTTYEGEHLVTTTGSFTSDFIELGKKYIKSALEAPLYDMEWTNLYEICATEDPHIVYEEPKAIFLGSRFKDGKFHPAPKTQVGVMQLKDALELAKEDSGEGFMVYHRDDKTFTAPCKIKSSGYVAKKLLMRAGSARLKSLDFRYYPETHKHYLDAVRDNLNFFENLEEQERRAFLEGLNKA